MGVKRKRKSVLSDTQLTKKDDEQIQLLGASINDIPLAIIFKIVLKLPAKTIVMCKSVNRDWYSLISDPLFAKVHLAQSKTCTLMRNNHGTKFSRSLYLLEPEDFACPDSGYCLCRDVNGQSCVHCRSRTAVQSRLKIPLRNPRLLLDKIENRRSSVVFCVATRSKSKHVIKLDSPINHRHDVVNSCNGLLCLSKSRLVGGIDKTNLIAVCNPVTGEFVHLPETCVENPNNSFGRFEFGLGFSPKHNLYKVIRLFNKVRTESTSRFMHFCVSRAEIHILGTDSWRVIDTSGFELGLLRSPSYLDGALYWVFIDSNGNQKLASFDLDEETFQVHSVPSQLEPPRFSLEAPQLAIRVIAGRLYLYTDLIITHIFIWVMDGTGSSRSWTLLFSIDASEFQCFHRRNRYQLLSCLNNEAMVMFCSRFNDFIYYDRVKGVTFKRLKFQLLASEFEAISFTPSFISLKDVLLQSNVEVSNINSGCGKLRILEETHPLLLGG